MENENKKLPFHLTITDNETGEVMQDCDFKCLIGAIHRGEGNIVGGVSITRCKGTELAMACHSAGVIVQRTYREHPGLAALAAMYDTEVREAGAQEDEEDQGQ